MTLSIATSSAKAASDAAIAILTSRTSIIPPLRRVAPAARLDRACLSRQLPTGTAPRLCCFRHGRARSGMATRLESAARHQALRSLRGWLEVPDADALHKTFHFSSFREAWGFLIQVALVAEQMGHYPEILTYVDRVEIRLMTQE